MRTSRWQRLETSTHRSPHQHYRVADFTVESGHVTKDFAVSYVVHGTLTGQKSHAVRRPLRAFFRERQPDDARDARPAAR